LIDPAGFKDRPKEPLGVAAFALALPSPAFMAERLEATRPVLRAGSTRIIPVLAGVTFQESSMPRVVPATTAPQPAILPQLAPDASVAVVTNAGAVQAPLVILGQPATQAVPDSGTTPAEVFYPAPVYTSVVVLNPPERQTTRPKPKPKPDPAPEQPPKPSKLPLGQGTSGTPASASSPPPRREPPPDAPPNQKPKPFEETKHDASGRQQ
jgi:hypothetical protein